MAETILSTAGSTILAQGDPPLRVLVLADGAWGGNWAIEEGNSSIRRLFETFGFELTTASVAGRVEPCAWAKGKGMVAFDTDLRTAAVSDVGAYDAVVVLPGRGHARLAADEAALALLREADRRGLAIAAFCRAVRVLAAAGILRGRRIAGHADDRGAFKAAGAEYVGYADLEGKADAPPPQVDAGLVTSLRSDYYRGAACDAIRVAAENARALRRSESSFLPCAAAPSARATFATLATRESEREVLLLVESLRIFGGKLAESTFLVMMPDRAPEISAVSKAALEGLGAEVRAFSLDPGFEALPFADKVLAAAAAEVLALERGRANEALVWMDADTMIVREPSELLLPAGAALAFRPVHHRLIGSLAGGVLEPFWERVFSFCGTDPAAAFPITSTIDRQRIRAYFNAGLLAARPGAGLFAGWAAVLRRALGSPGLKTLIDGDGRTRVFLHQALLAAVAPRLLPRSAMRELSFAYNYPLHLHARCPSELKPGKLEDLVTMRYEDRAEWLGREDWRELMPPSGRLASWLEVKAAEGPTVAP
jgi:putative intracellular protease/amidase